MNKLVAAVLAAFVSTAALAQAAANGGEVTKIDKAGARITLKHSGIKNLDMPPMTMAFKVSDGKLLDSVAVGDKVRFAADKIDGTYTLTAIAKTP